jgi:hypothetical protein
LRQPRTRNAPWGKASLRDGSAAKQRDDGEETKICNKKNINDMKKIVSFALLLCSVVVLNAQNQIGFVYDGTVYQNGDSILVTCEKDASHIDAISFRNQTSSVLRDLVVTMTEVARHGFEAWGLCTTQCVATLTSTPFMMTPNEEFTGFVIDITIDPNVENPYAVYTLEVSNGTITCAVLVRFEARTVGIDDVLANSRVKAFPNPAQGQFGIGYSVEQPSVLAIYDAQGRQVRQMAVSGNGTARVSNLPAGVYAYGIVNGKQRGPMQKLIVK